MEEEKETKLAPGRKAIPVEVLQKRRRTAVELYTVGLSIAAIQRRINTEDKKENWGQVSYRTVERDIASFYRDNQIVASEDFDHLDQMRRAHLAGMEQTIEKLAIHIINTSKSDSWKPFQLEKALETLHKMRMDYAELMNWNLGRKNPLVAVQNNFNLQGSQEAAHSELRGAKPEAVEQLMAQLKLAASQFKNDDRREVQDTVIVDAEVADAQTEA